MMQWKITDGQNKKNLLNMKLRHVEITVIKQQREFHYFIDIIRYYYGNIMIDKKTSKEDYSNYFIFRF